MMHDSKVGWERYDQNKPKCSEFGLTPMNLSWTNIFGNRLSRLRKKFEILTKCSLKNKESIKKWCAISRSDEGDMIKTRPSAPNSDLLQWIPTKLKFFGGPHFLPYSMMWTTKEISHDGTPKWTTHPHYIGPQMNLHKAQKLIKAKRGPWRGHMKTWVHVTPIG